MSSRFEDVTLEHDGPEADPPIANAGFDADKIGFKFEGWQDGVEFEKVADQSWVSDLGTNRPAEGLATGTFQFNTYCHGQGTARTATIAEETALGIKLSSTLGAAPVFSTGDTTAAGAHTETAITVTTPGNHEPDQIAAFEIDGELYVRPIAERAAGLLTLGMGLPAGVVPDAGGGEVIYGAENVAWVDAPAYTSTLRKIGSSQYRNRQFRGVVYDLEMREAGEGEIPQLGWTGRCVTFDRLGTTSGYAQTAPPARRPKIVAGGQYLIAKDGSAQTPKQIEYVRASVKINGGWVRIPGPNDQLGADPTFPWRRVAGDGVPCEVMLHVAHESTPPTGTGSASWEAMVDSQADADILQVLLAHGRSVAGEICAVWARHLILTGWKEVGLEGLSAQQLTFRILTGYSASPLVISNM